MSTLARKRLLRDLKKIKLDNTDGIIAHPHSNNLMRWTATIFGPPDSVFANGVFRLQLDFPEDYPTRAPKVVFVTDVFHPNVYVNGEICLDILQKQWSSAYNVGTILTSIQSLLDEPNPDSPANNEAAKLFVDDKMEYERRVLKCVEASWIDGGMSALKRAKIDAASSPASTSTSA